MMKNKIGMDLAAIFILKKCGVQLSPELKSFEKKMVNV